MNSLAYEIRPIRKSLEQCRSKVLTMYRRNQLPYEFKNEILSKVDKFELAHKVLENQSLNNKSSIRQIKQQIEDSLHELLEEAIISAWLEVDKESDFIANRVQTILKAREERVSIEWQH